MQHVELFNQNGRRWVFLGRDPQRSDQIIDTNVYLLVNQEEGALLDPGGIETFPAVVSAVSQEISIDKLHVLFASHQDPDIISSLSLWLSVMDDVRMYAPWIWSTFIPHFGGGIAITPIPDAGMPLPLGGSTDIRFIPAHYLHSAGNMNVYDPMSKILFTGDIGAALLPEGKTQVFVDDFAEHTRYMETFHKRWMPSNAAKERWLRRVSALELSMLCPQHGAIFRGDDIKRFLDWFASLEVGIAE